MTRVLPISFSNNNISNDVNNNKSRKYPVTYEQFKNKSIAGSAFGALVFGLLTTGIVKLLKFSKNTAITGGSIAGGSLFLLSLVNGMNGDFKLKYLRQKERYENPKLKTSIILSDFEPEN